MRGPRLAEPQHPTLVAALEAASRRRGGVTFIDGDERERWLAWSAIFPRAARAAAAYAAMGVRPGDRIGIVLKTEPAFLDAFFGAWLAAAVPVPLPAPRGLSQVDPWLEEAERLVRLAGPVLLVANGSTRRLMGKLVDRVRPPLGCHDAAALAETPARIQREVSPDDLALVQLVGDGPGGPRPALLTHAALMAQVQARGAAVRLTGEDLIVSWLSVSHDSGLVGGLLGALAGPASLVLLSREAVAAQPALWLRAVARHRGTVTVAPASAYGRAAAVVKDEALARCSLETLRVALARAEPGATEALRAFSTRFEAIGLDPGALAITWGLAEPALAVSLRPPGQPLVGLRLDAGHLARQGEVVPGTREVTDVGRPLPGVEVEVRDEQGRAVPEGRLGRLWLRAPRLLAGTEVVGALGWLDSGDMGFAKDGDLYLHARAEELVVLRGARHAPEEFEGPALLVHGLTAAVALTMPPPQGQDGALLLLAERATDDARVDPALEVALRRTLLERTGVAPHTVRVLSPGALPRTLGGRLRRGEALRRYQAGTLSPPPSVNPVRLALVAARSQLAFARLRLRSR